MRRLAQTVWDSRAAAAGLAWVAPVKSILTPTAARCLTCGHRWTPWPSGVSQGHGCPRCAGRIVTQDEWDARAAAVSIVWEAPVTHALVNTPARCLKCGHRWNAPPNHVQQGRGCPACLRVPQAEWDRRAKERGLAWEAPGVTSDDRAPARCLTCGYRWSVTPAKVAEGRGCPRCAGRIVTQAEWDARARIVGIEWEQPVENANHPSPARCLTCGHRWLPWPTNVSRGQGCPQCHGPGFDSQAPGRLYLLTLPELGLLKIGVTGELGIRLDRHRSRGWQVAGVWRFDDGRSALDAETAVLKWWQAQGAAFCDRHEVPGGDGWTECVHAGVVDIPRTTARVEELRVEVLQP